MLDLLNCHNTLNGILNLNYRCVYVIYIYLWKIRIINSDNSLSCEFFSVFLVITLWPGDKDLSTLIIKIRPLSLFLYSFLACVIMITLMLIRFIIKSKIYHIMNFINPTAPNSEAANDVISSKAQAAIPRVGVVVFTVERLR